MANKPEDEALVEIVSSILALTREDRAKVYRVLRSHMQDIGEIDSDGEVIEEGVDPQFIDVFNGVNYRLTEHQTFINDMIVNDMEDALQLYHGRNNWHGPAVRTSDYRAVQANTSVKCNVDQLGRRFIVYPVASDRELENARENK